MTTKAERIEIYKDVCRKNIRQAILVLYISLVLVGICAILQVNYTWLLPIFFWMLGIPACRVFYALNYLHLEEEGKWFIDQNIIVSSFVACFFFGLMGMLLAILVEIN